MPQRGWIFRALVASPSDCVHERKIIPEVIATWNAVHSLSTGAIIEPVLWETHSRPQLGGRPQTVLNKQLVNHCDLVVGAFWTRLGTPTGKSESGTAEEIEQFREAGKPVLLYFSSAPVVPDSLDAEQYSALTEYKKRLGKEGLYSEYDSLAVLRQQLERHLAGHMIELIKQIPGASQQLVNESTPQEGQNTAQQQFCAEFETSFRRIKAEWGAERDSDPFKTEEGKMILDHAESEILHFSSMITNDAIGLSDDFPVILKQLRSLRRHQTYMDGGVSFKEFWDKGDAIIESIGNVVSKVCGAIQGNQ